MATDKIKGVMKWAAVYVKMLTSKSNFSAVPPSKTGLLLGLSIYNLHKSALDIKAWKEQ